MKFYRGLLFSLVLVSLSACGTATIKNNVFSAGLPVSVKIVRYNQMKASFNSQDKSVFHNFIVGMDSIKEVHTKFNAIPYISDKYDEWKTPNEFILNGGDCEDYAVAKYYALKAIGFPVSDLEIFIGQTSFGPHAILVVKHNKKRYVLDNNKKNVIESHDYTNFIPKYSINEQGTKVYFQ